jgi:hypothetical protein
MWNKLLEECVRLVRLCYLHYAVILKTFSNGKTVLDVLTILKYVQTCTFVVRYTTIFRKDEVRRDFVQENVGIYRTDELESFEAKLKLMQIIIYVYAFQLQLSTYI